LIGLHALAAVIWVGGMFFAYMALRPAAALLEPPLRLKLWSQVFARFFRWIWAAIIILPLTGYWMMFAQFGGMGNAPVYGHIMNGLGSVMILIYLHLFFAPYRQLNHALAEQNIATAGAKLGVIRRLIATNLILGLIVIAVATGGRYLEM
jgi:uncharacterized membrane protein